jgi:hypothetical protein
MRFGGASQVRLARRCALALAVACALAPAAAVARSAPGEGELSPRLATLAEPGLRTASAAAQAEALSLAPSGAGSLLRDGGRVLAYVRFDAGVEAGVESLRAVGAEIVDVSLQHRTVTVAAAPALLPRLADVAGVGGVTEALAPLLRAANCAGSVRSEGDTQLTAPRAREDFNVDGNGVTVGILSDSFDRAAAAVTHAGGDVSSGDLPGPGTTCGSSTLGLLDDTAGGDDEGRAMAQIVHDLAPGAAIGFATAFKGELGFAANIRALARSGAKVIVDDVAYLEEPFFQDGPVASAVAEVVSSGVSYFAATGNDNVIVAGRNVASWEAPAFRQTSCPPALEAAVGTERCMGFNPSGTADPTFAITVAPGDTLRLDLQWAEPWNGVGTDLDAYLLDALGNPLFEEDDEGNPILDDEGNPIPVGAYGNNIASQKPVELLQWENPSNSAVKVQLAIDRCLGACNPAASPLLLPRLKFALLRGGVVGTEYPASSGGDVVGPTVFGHAGSSAAIAVGAVRYNDGGKPESYSSRGPVKHFFGPVTGAAPAPPIFPRETAKPDLAASDCVATTFFSQRDSAGAWRFCGTSAAAPHAAAVAALIREANPGASAAQVRAALVGSARGIPNFGLNDVGAGLVDAGAAVSALALPPTVTLTKTPEPLSRSRRPTVEFKSNRPVTFSCAVDGASPQICSSPYTLPYGVADGQHGIAVTAVDRAGRSASSGVASFRVDTRAPRTRIAKRPRKVVRIKRRQARLRFRFRASEPGVIFVCKVDRGLLRFCGPNFSRRFAAGKHVVVVRARDAAGNVDRTPAVFHFRVKRVGRG